MFPAPPPLPSYPQEASAVQMRDRSKFSLQEGRRGEEQLTAAHHVQTALLRSCPDFIHSFLKTPYDLTMPFFIWYTHTHNT